MRIIDGKKLKLDKVLKEVIAVFKKGGLVVVPSDTVYGLSVDATDQKSVSKLLSFKERIPGKAVSVFVPSLSMAAHYAHIGKKKEKIIEKILPGPFTVVLRSKGKVDERIESEKGTLGIRLPDFNFIEKLVKKYNKPITATSANISGRSPHYSIKSFLNRISKKKKEMLDLIVDYGKLPRNKPSSVIDLTGKEVKTLRRGDIRVSKVDEKTQKFTTHSPDETKQIAKFLIRKKLRKIEDKPLVFLIEGRLGVGKTVFVKGVGEELDVGKIISPTFVIFYEYKVKGERVKNLYHFDLYRIEEPEEFEYLGVEKILKTGNIICVEWGEKSAKIFDQLKSKGDLTYIKMRFLGKGKREIESFDI